MTEEVRTMVKCPFCHFDNEDGALFCEQCKSDLAVTESAAVPLPATAPAPPRTLPPGAEPKLVVLRGLRMHVEYPIFPGPNYVGRVDEQPVDVDLEDQDASDPPRVSRQHALITFDNGTLTIKDLK